MAHPHPPAPIPLPPAPPMPPTPGICSPNSWAARFPALRTLPAAARERLLCPRCDGSGQTTEGFVCKPCAGVGLRCPTCTGAGWLVNGAAQPGERTLLRCPGCATAQTLAATIQAFIARAGTEASR